MLDVMDKHRLEALSHGVIAIILNGCQTPGAN
jgi:uncharacterized membrane protein